MIRHRPLGSLVFFAASQLGVSLQAIPTASTKRGPSQLRDFEPLRMTLTLLVIGVIEKHPFQAYEETKGIYESAIHAS
ncbi:MAG TPA: hypothetical protein DCE44_11255 [Verrucomicrobiales bacterium]|nr:hypothetical protein [Verrucomicrobiales bacterium]